MARQNDHIRAEELISAYLDKRITAEEKSFFERHIASCADCHAQLEATRSMVASLRAMPLVKAPRSFVLPREMARQPRRSFLPLYPALRLATVIAAMAFVILFAGDVLINQLGSNGAAQPAPAAVPPRVVLQAPEAARQVVPTQEAAGAEIYGAAPAEPPSAADAATSSAAANAAAGTATADATPEPSAKAALSSTAVMTESAMAMGLPTVTPEATAIAQAADQARAGLESTPVPSEPSLEQQAAPAAEQPAAENVTAPALTVEPLRIFEIVLLILAVGFGIAALAARRKQA
jgi:hypothetical protein